MSASLGVRATLGREAELEAIGTMLSRLEAGPRALFLHGPPGIGKTHVWLEGVELARARGVRVCTTRPAEADARVAFAALRDLVGESADEVLPELPGPQRSALAVVLLLEEPRPRGPDADAISAAIVGALRLLSRQQPLLLAVDDVQWLDASSRAALAFALRRLEAEGVGLLATVRTERGVHVGDLVSALPPEQVERRDLAPLKVAAVYELVRERFGVSLPRPTLLRLHELSGGNPYFALELVRGMSETFELTVPRDLSELLRARLASLSGETRDVLLAAAVLAQPTRGTLEAFSDRADEALEEARAADVVELGPDAVRFTHPLLAAEVYGEASPLERQAAHGRLAAVVDDGEERARHLALGSAAPDEEVAVALDEATAGARARGALAAAAELGELALELTPFGSPRAHARALTAADLRYSSGDRAGAEVLLTAALERAEDDRARAEILLSQAKLAYERDQAASRDLFLAVLEHADEDDTLRVDALTWLAGWFMTAGEALAYAESAVRTAEKTGDPATISRALSALATTRYLLTGEISAELHERAVGLAESVGDADAVSDTTLEFAAALLDSWEYDRARVLLELLIARERASGVSDVATPLENLAFVELGTGNLDRAAELAREAAEVAALGGRLHSEMYALFRLGWIEALRGNVDEARALCSRSLRLAEESSGFLRGARLILGYLESALESYEAAWSYLDPADPLTGVMPPGRPVIHVPEAVEVLVGLRRAGQARELLEPFGERAAALGRVWAIALAAHCRGLILAEEGDLEGAETAALQAVGLTGANGWPLHLGRALLALGSVQRRRGQKAEARASLERAEAIFDERGARIWSERVRKELRRIGGRRAPAGADLSETEARIAELVVAGKTNSEVAATLHLSRKTVEWNLSKVYRKLGVRSRTELASRYSAD